jgi:hypothetical protein
MQDPEVNALTLFGAPRRSLVNHAAIFLEIRLDRGDQIIQQQLPANICLHPRKKVAHLAPLV